MVAQVGCEGLRPGELGAIHKFAFTEVGGGGRDCARTGRRTEACFTLNFGPEAELFEDAPGKCADDSWFCSINF